MRIWLIYQIHILSQELEDKLHNINLKYVSTNNMSHTLTLATIINQWTINDTIYHEKNNSNMYTIASKLYNKPNSFIGTKGNLQYDLTDYSTMMSKPIST